MVPDDYIHRVGRTARAEATGEAFTFVSPEEESDLRAIERAIGKRLPRVTVPDFDYTARPQAEARDPAGRADCGDSEDEVRAAGQIRDEERADHTGPKAGSAHGARPAPSGGPKSPSHGPGAARPRGPGGPGAGGRGRGPSRGGQSWGGRGNQ